MPVPLPQEITEDREGRKEVPREGGPPFIAELQVALSGIAILKKSEEDVCRIMRMNRPGDLVDAFVFDQDDLSKPLSPELTPKFGDGPGPHFGRVETDLGDVAVEVEAPETSNEHMEAQPKTPRLTDPVIIQSAAPMGFMPGIFSCDPDIFSCDPCDPAPGDRALVSAVPSVQVKRSSVSINDRRRALQVTGL